MGRHDIEYNDTQHNDSQHTGQNCHPQTSVFTVLLSATSFSHQAECRFAECRGAIWVFPNLDF